MERRIPRVVLDTNIYISAFGWSGAEERLVLMGLQGRVALILCEQLIEEFIKTITRPRLGFPEHEAREFIKGLLDSSVLVDISEPVSGVCRDPEDDYILGLAVSAQAEYIVTGDRALLELKIFRGIRILRAPELVKIICD